MSTLSQVLRDKILPWSEAGVNGRIVVARRKMRVSDMPTGVELIHQKIPGERVIIKGGRNYGNARSVIAEWPEARLHEVNAPRFICVVEGRINFRAGDYLLNCGSGDFLLIPPGVPHPGRWKDRSAAASSVPGQSCLLLWMALYQRGVQCWFSRYENDARITGSAAENYLFFSEPATQFFRLFVEEATGERHEALCNKLVSAYFTTLQRELATARYLHPGLFTKAESSSASSTDFLQNLTNYIQQHLHQPLRLAQVAREFYMSPTQFMRRMRQESGQTFVELLTSYRIKEAKILLTESEWSVQTIASFVGFTSVTYFNSLFRRHVGCPPGEFRLRSQNTCGKTKKG